MAPPPARSAGSTQPLQNTSLLVPDPLRLWCGRLGPLADLVGERGRDVGVAAVEFAREAVVGLLGQRGRHQVVGAREAVEAADGEAVVGAFAGFPGWVAEGGGGWEG